MILKDLIIINNERVFVEDNNFYCENLNLKILTEELNNFYKVQYIARKSKKKKFQKINLENIKIAPNIIKFIYFLFKSFKISKANYLLVSITPYTFISFLFLTLFRKKIFIYLISKGQEEYKYILGNWAIWIYDLMYKVVTLNSQIIVCHERLFDKKKSHLINVSRLDDSWLKNRKEAILDKAKFLYVGRMSQEKGIFDFIEMFSEIKLKSEFSIVGNLNNYPIQNENIKLLGYISDPKLLIETYDNHNITILPSYTEASPYVVDESLARKRPIIIFDEISYIVRDKFGIFISKRDTNAFLQTTKYVMDNYSEIQRSMEKNLLPTKNNMIKQICKIIENKNFNS